MAVEEINSTIGEFAGATAIAARWDAARRLMASKSVSTWSTADQFDKGWRLLATSAAALHGIDQLLAIDLIVRLSAFVKRLQQSANEALDLALAGPIAPLDSISETAGLPPEAKPAEIRENVAIALARATGEWVESYLYNALAREDRSSRSRLELARRIAEREPNVSVWLQRLAATPHLDSLEQEAGADTASGRLRDLARTFSEVISGNRRKLVATTSAGTALNVLCYSMLPPRSHRKVPSTLVSAASAVLTLLDEIISADLTIVVEAETYACLGTIRRWWAPLPYPDKLQAELAAVREKVLAAIVLRARLGQRSDELVQRLSSTFDEASGTRDMLRGVVEEHPGLSPEIVDWLSGNDRDSSSSRAVNALTSVYERSFLVDFSYLLSQAINNEERNDRLLDQLLMLAHRFGLEVLGRTGDIVEYSSRAHETTSGRAPSEPRVKITTPGIARRLPDGSLEYLVRAKVG